MKGTASSAESAIYAIWIQQRSVIIARSASDWIIMMRLNIEQSKLTALLMKAWILQSILINRFKKEHPVMLFLRFVSRIVSQHSFLSSNSPVIFGDSGIVFAGGIDVRMPQNICHEIYIASFAI